MSSNSEINPYKSPNDITEPKLIPVYTKKDVGRLFCVGLLGEFLGSITLYMVSLGVNPYVDWILGPATKALMLFGLLLILTLPVVFKEELFDK